MRIARMPFLSCSDWPTNAREAWYKTHATEDDFGLPIGERPLPITLQYRQESYGRVLHFARRRVPDDVMGGVATWLAEPEFLREYVNELQQHYASFTCAVELQRLSAAVKDIHPEVDRTLLMRAASTLWRRARPITKFEDRLVRPDHAYHEGIAMTREADESDGGLGRRATKYRNGLMIALGAICPLRPRNLHEMQEGEDVYVLDGSGHVTIRSTKMKGRKKQFVGQIPEELVERLRRYMSYYRPIIVRKRGDADPSALWVTYTGKAMCKRHFGRTITTTLKLRTGRNPSPQMFRHAAATFVIDSAPHLAQLAPAILMHSKISTTRKHYIKSQRKKSLQIYQTEVQDIISRSDVENRDWESSK